MKDETGEANLVVSLSDGTLEFSLRLGEEVSYSNSTRENTGYLFFDLKDLGALCLRLSEDEPFEDAEIPNPDPEILWYTDSTTFRVVFLLTIGPCYIHAHKHRFTLRNRGVEQHLLIYRYLGGRPNVDGFTIVASAEEFGRFGRETLEILCDYQDLVDPEVDEPRDDEVAPE